MKNRNITLLIVLVIGLIAWFLFSKYRVAPEVDMFSQELYDADGNKTNLGKFRGKKLIVTYWATWCGQCLKELKVLNEIKGAKLSDVEIIAITDDEQDVMSDFITRKNYPFHFFRIGKKFSDIGIHAIPVNYLVNTKGNVVFNKVGSPDWEDNSFIAKAQSMME